MEEFRFANPEYLLALLALPALGFALARIRKGAQERLLRFVAAANLRQLLRGPAGRAAGWQGALFWLGLAFCIVAWARPQANPITEEMEGASLDIYVLLDVSRSMDAEDVPPSRLKKAKREIQSLMSLLGGDRVGLIAFAGSSIIVSPLTSDYEVVKTFLQNIDTDLIQNQTTNIGAALTLAEQAMKRGAERTGADGLRSNVFVVMSDGEDQQSKSDYSVADAIQKAGGTIFTIAFGTEAGAKIPARNTRGELMGYKRDRRTGQEVTSSVQTKGLEEIAQRGGGQFYFSTADEGEVRDILNRMQNMQRTGAVVMKARIYQEYFAYVLGAALLALLLSFVAPRARWWEPGFWRRAGGGALVLLFGLLAGAPAEASPWSLLWDRERSASEKSQALAFEGKNEEAVNNLKGLLAENPDSPALNYNVGTYLLQGKQNAQGREQLERLREGGGPLKHRALFNLAGSYASEGKKEEARAAYADLLQSLNSQPGLNGEERKIQELARKNLVRLADPKQSPQQQQQQQQNQDQNKDQQNQDQKSQDQKKDEKESKDQKDQKESKDSKDQKDSKDAKDQQEKDKKDGKDGEDQKKEEPKPDEGKEKKDEQKPQEQKGKEEKQQQAPRKGRQPFKERQNLGEEDAKRLLEELKLHETGLQKKFLKKQENGGTFTNDDAAKDW